MTVDEFLEVYMPPVSEGTVVVLSSKVIALCQNRVVPFGKITKSDLVALEADKYLPASASQHGHQFSLKNNSLVGAAGIDTSKGNAAFILWPAQPQATANQIRLSLTKRLGVKKLGVILCDSVSTPLRRGAIGISIAHSGFVAVKKYKVGRANIAGGLAAAASTAMGEGPELQPIAIINDLPPLEFQSRNPTQAELDDYYLSESEDLFAPFLGSVNWHNGGKIRPSTTD